jgi:hypothetical protein
VEIWTTSFLSHFVVGICGVQGGKVLGVNWNSNM